MSKASEWAEKANAGDRGASFRMSGGRRLVADYRRGISRGRVTLYVQPNTLEQKVAIEFARWILDTFSDEPHS